MCLFYEESKSYQSLFWTCNISKYLIVANTQLDQEYIDTNAPHQMAIHDRVIPTSNYRKYIIKERNIASHAGCVEYRLNPLNI